MIAYRMPDFFFRSMPSNYMVIGKVLVSSENDVLILFDSITSARYVLLFLFERRVESKVSGQGAHY